MNNKNNNKGGFGIIRKKPSNSNNRNNDTLFCTNCGSKRHTYKQCPEPVTSWGVILVSYDGLDKPKHEKNIDLTLTDMTETENRVLIESKSDSEVIGLAFQQIKFLMVSRKHSVGYVEFIRGRYRPEMIDQVVYLFKQMMQKEIDRISKSLEMPNGFDFLWNDFWGNKADSSHYSNDRKISKAHYELLRIKDGVDGPELNLSYIVNTVKADFSIEEWGFPKGRRNINESDEECAIREFKEESGFEDSEFKVIHEIKPLVEDFVGTNGIKYRHVYYIAESLTNKQPKKDSTESQRDEIGDIQFMDFSTANSCIRDYHVHRKTLLSKLFVYYLDRLVISNRSK